MKRNTSKAKVTSQEMSNIALNEMPATELNEEELSQYFAQETLTLELQTLRSIGQTAKKLNQQLRSLESWLTHTHKTLALVNKNKEKQNLLQKAQYQKRAAEWERVVKEAYAFIQKTRKFFTGETLEYLILFDENLSGQRGATKKDSKIMKLSLDQLLTTVSLDISGDFSEARLRINNKISLLNIYNELNNVQRLQANLEKQILDNFQKILEKRAERYREKQLELNNDSTLSQKEKKSILSKLFTSRGFAFETAVIIGDRAVDYVSAYKQDTEAFWRGGDLQQGVDNIPEALVSKDAHINYELKRVSATAENSVGAGLATLNGLITALTTIQNILLNPNLLEKDMQKTLNTFLFKAKRNIRRETAEIIGELAAEELNKIIE